MYVAGDEFLLSPTTVETFFFHLMPLSPLPALPPIPHMVPHPYLSLWTAAHSFFPLSLVLFPPLPSGIFQFQIITPLHSRLSFIPPLFLAGFRLL